MKKLLCSFVTSTLAFACLHANANPDTSFGSTVVHNAIGATHLMENQTIDAGYQFLGLRPSDDNLIDSSLLSVIDSAIRETGIFKKGEMPDNTKILVSGDWIYIYPPGIWIQLDHSGGAPKAEVAADWSYINPRSK